MFRHPTCLCAILLAASASALHGQEQWRSLFNGKDLSGWVNVNLAPTTFSVKDGIIVSTGVTIDRRTPTAMRPT